MDNIFNMNDDVASQAFPSAYLEPFANDEGMLLDDATLMQPPFEIKSEFPLYGKSYKKTKAGLLPDKPYMCKTCNTPFTNSSNLKAHERTHTGEKPYVCEICDLAFVQSSNLKAHMRIHTGERPYSCDICHQTFSRSSHLTGHKRTHTGEKPYVCGTCGESFATSTHLRNHVRKHNTVNPYMCNICEVSFQQNVQLKQHMKEHNGDRPYRCCDCAGAFRSKGDLRSHRKLHSDDRPFICGKCGKTFKTYSYLCKHLVKCGIAPTVLPPSTSETPGSVTEIFVPGENAIKDEPVDLNNFQLIDENGQLLSFHGLLDAQISLGDLDTAGDQSKLFVHKNDKSGTVETMETLPNSEIPSFEIHYQL